ncbi:hypothetical protein [uncultured Rikenella sp.]|uniref:hypothetical protein n=1 Tax=uncultured Rikenella sp. TaxID=368003 RepID=UPI00272C890C|nr:hypothetical protein [uncultured Rikenella sp.]
MPSGEEEGEAKLQTDASHPQAAGGTILCSRALGNLVKTRKRILTISLFRRGARLV